ncbi:MAG: PPC domain-containing protein [Anaerolineae bacterium]|jgi:hypothetical protein|nr:PPC domain-containing protein [Anaerolineae bacterium]
MRKNIVFGLVAALVAVLALPLVVTSVAEAQGGEALELGQWVEGELTEAEYEVFYTFEGTAGTVLVFEMYATTYDLDPVLILRDPSGVAIAQNDDFSGLDSMLILELPADGEYTILATRSGGSTGSSFGPYRLRASEASVLEVGGSVEATVYADYEKDMPNLFVVKPEATGTYAFSFEQPEGDLRAMFRLSNAEDDMLVFELTETAGVRTGTLNTDLEGGMVYVLTVRQSFMSFVMEDISIQVTVSLDEVAPAE